MNLGNLYGLKYPENIRLKLIYKGEDDTSVYELMVKSNNKCN